MPVMEQTRNWLNGGEPTQLREVLPNHVARYWDMVAYADRSPVTVIGETGLLRDKPGFEVQFMTRTSCLNDASYHTTFHLF